MSKSNMGSQIALSSSNKYTLWLLLLLLTTSVSYTFIYLLSIYRIGMVDHSMNKLRIKSFTYIIIA